MILLSTKTLDRPLFATAFERHQLELRNLFDRVLRNAGSRTTRMSSQRTLLYAMLAVSPCAAQVSAGISVEQHDPSIPIGALASPSPTKAAESEWSTS